MKRNVRVVPVCKSSLRLYVLPIDFKLRKQKRRVQKNSRFLYNKQTCRWVRAGNLALLKMWSVEQSVCSAHVTRLKKGEKFYVEGI